MPDPPFARLETNNLPLVESKTGEFVTIRDFPHLAAEDLVNAAAYAATHPAEIEEAICRNQDN